MKTVEKENLVKNTIYVVFIGTSRQKYIFKFIETLRSCININTYLNLEILYKEGDFDRSDTFFCESTLQEKHWLETCIKANDFISNKEARKTFALEFVLPEIWHIIVTEENQKILSGWRECKNGYLLPINHLTGLTKNNSGKITKGHNTGTEIKKIGMYNNTGFDFGNEITLEQFKQCVLKKISIVNEILEEPKDKILVDGNGKYIGAQSAEGGIFKIGDVITPFSEYSPNKGTPYIISSFRWTVDTSEICAITNGHQGNGIRLW